MYVSYKIFKLKASLFILVPLFDYLAFVKLGEGIL
jgi:hypothetical protein